MVRLSCLKELNLLLGKSNMLKLLGLVEKEGTCLFDINNHNTEYTSVKFCWETSTKAQSVPLSREPPTC